MSNTLVEENLNDIKDFMLTEFLLVPDAEFIGKDMSRLEYDIDTSSNVIELYIYLTDNKIILSFVVNLMVSGHHTYNNIDDFKMFITRKLLSEYVNEIDGLGHE